MSLKPLGIYEVQALRNAYQLTKDPLNPESYIRMLGALQCGTLQKDFARLLDSAESSARMNTSAKPLSLFSQEEGK